VQSGGIGFSCRTRNFCSSCQAKRSVLFAEKLTGGILAPVPHRHWTFSIPRVLRGLFERERALLSLLSQTAFDAGHLVLQTPSDPRSGATSITLDPLEWIHRIASHFPDPGRHCQRFYGAYSNRARTPASCAPAQATALPPAKFQEQDIADNSRETGSTWARLVRKIFEADPLLCTCGGRMRIISFITEPRVVDRILRHRESARCQTQDPFEPRAPPGAVEDLVQ
jgi:hypothetical protein